MENRAYLGSISVELTQQALRDAFSAHDEIVAVFVTADRVTGQPRRISLATRGSSEQAERAISLFGGADADSEGNRPSETYEWRDTKQGPPPLAAHHRGRHPKLVEQAATPELVLALPPLHRARLRT